MGSAGLGGGLRGVSKSIEQVEESTVDRGYCGSVKSNELGQQPDKVAAIEWGMTASWNGDGVDMMKAWCGAAVSMGVVAVRREWRVQRKQDGCDWVLRGENRGEEEEEKETEEGVQEKRGWEKKWQYQPNQPWISVYRTIRYRKKWPIRNIIAFW